LTLLHVLGCPEAQLPVGCLELGEGLVVLGHDLFASRQVGELNLPKAVAVLAGGLDQVENLCLGERLVLHCYSFGGWYLVTQLGSLLPYPIQPCPELGPKMKRPRNANDPRNDTATMTSVIFCLRVEDSPRSWTNPEPRQASTLVPPPS
jgi:hypothetical protein